MWLDRRANCVVCFVDTSSVTNSQAVQVLSRRKLQDLLHEIDPRETMDEDVEEVC